eukprot:TRINITY_DN46678_c0_g1_i1.p1 TRINITY_DN46678_c0_g1~~TRINITY_DN46678_c0_g1_i1.p1  ORF type:complete len:468 (+),score=127.44 TRINITY_DN46678_c0_g1_i1:91-1494(+)
MLAVATLLRMHLAVDCPSERTPHSKVVRGYTTYEDARCTGRDDICAPGEPPCDQAYTAVECARLCERLTHCVSFAFRRCGAAAQREAELPSRHCALSATCTNMQADAVCKAAVLPRPAGSQAASCGRNTGADCWDLYLRDRQYALRGGGTACGGDTELIAAELECNTAAVVLRLPKVCSARAAIARGCWTSPYGLWWSEGGDGALAGAVAVCRLRCPLPAVIADGRAGGPLTAVRATPEWGEECCRNCSGNETWCAPRNPSQHCDEAHPPISAESLELAPSAAPVAPPAPPPVADWGVVFFVVFFVVSVLLCSLVILASCQHSSTMRHCCGDRNWQRFLAALPAVLLGAAQVETDAAPVSEKEMVALSTMMAVRRPMPPPPPLPAGAPGAEPRPPLPPPPSQPTAFFGQYSAHLERPRQGSVGSDGPPPRFGEFVAATHPAPGAESSSPPGAARSPLSSTPYRQVSD